MAKKDYEIDMCHGPLLGKLLLFTLPVMFSGILQLLFNAADVVVVGRFAGSEALAAVGSNGALVALIVNVFVGVSVGTNVLVAQYYGAGKPDEVNRVVHTSILTSLVFGVILVFVGCLLAGPLLRLMGTPEEVLGLAEIYLRIYFIGMPVNMLYNFGSAVLRAVGDTRRPLYFLVISGVVNVILNLFFVIPLRMSVAGVALATIISQAVSAVLVLWCLCKSEGSIRLEWHKLRIDRKILLRMVRIGLPAGVQGAIFSVSNILIQSSVNSFGSVAMAGNAAASNLEGFVYISMNSFHQAAISFTSQNAGAGDYRRVKKAAGLCLLMVSITGLVMGLCFWASGGMLLRVYTGDAEVIRYGLLRMKYICILYFTCGCMDTAVGVLRGLGYSIVPTLVSLTGACLFRVIWIFTIFRWRRALETLYVSYPLSWILTLSVHLICLTVILHKLQREK